MQFSEYQTKTHLYGRIATIIAMIVMLGIPAIICSTYDIWPKFSDVMTAAAPMLAIFIPSALSEVISFTPISGSAGYIGSIMGNVSNIKAPCNIAAMERTNSPSGTERCEAISMCASCISGIVTTIIIAIGVILLVPLQPILTSPTVSTATKYIMPALFGSMATSAFLNKNAGTYVIEGKMKLVCVLLVLVLALYILFPATLALQGYVMMCLIPIAIGIARIFYNKGIVKVIEKKATSNGLK